MAQRLLNVPKPESSRTELPVSNRPLKPSTKLSDLLGPESWFIFHALDLGYEWLIESPDLWNSLESFQEAKRFVCNVKVVNDAAERNVKFYFRVFLHFDSRPRTTH